MTDKGGRPEVTIPESEPPSTLQVQPLIKGEGKKIGANDTITFNYSWVRWSDGKVLEETYGGEPAVSPLSGLLPGMVKGLTDQTVGSRVLLVIPPADGYPDGNATPSIKPGRDAGHGGRFALHAESVEPAARAPVTPLAQESRSVVAWRPAAAAARK